jgi:signal transduction histidine kinase
MIPIQNLTSASGVISAGKYPEAVSVLNNDELGVLSNTFNKMIERLKLQEKELETERLSRATISIDSIDEERRRLSRELHDGLGQTLTAIKLKLESIDSEDPDIDKKFLKNIKFDIDSSISEIRHISNDIMPAVLIEFGLVNALRNLCEDISENSKIEVNFRQSYKSRLTRREETYLFRIAQEALKNAIKHSSASLIMIDLQSTDTLLTLTISDNGIGFDSKNVIYGNGIFNMKERAKIE